MRICVMTEPQEGATYEELLTVAKKADELGFDGFFRSDHYSSLRGPGISSTDAWATLAGLARETSRIRLGTLMSPITWRHPSVLAKTVTTVDEMSSGRIELGIGTGWMPTEHEQFGFRFEDFKTRFIWLEEALQIITGLWTNESFTFEGSHFSVKGASLEPKPIQKPHPPILVGGGGAAKTPRIAARYANEWNGILEPESYDKAKRRVVEECEMLGRDPKNLTYSAMTGVIVGSTTKEFEERAAKTTQKLLGTSDARPWIESRRGRWAVGTPEEAAEVISRYAEVGCQRIMLQVFDLDPAHLEVIWNEVRPKVVS